MTDNPTQYPTLAPTPYNPRNPYDGYDLLLFLFIFFIFTISCCRGIMRSTHTRAVRHLRIHRMAAIGAPYDVELAQVDFTSFMTIIKPPVRNQTNCVICMGDFEANDTLALLPNCDHIYHKHCINTWLNENPICPVCRTRIF